MSKKHFEKIKKNSKQKFACGSSVTCEIPAFSIFRHIIIQIKIHSYKSHVRSFRNFGEFFLYLLPKNFESFTKKNEKVRKFWKKKRIFFLKLQQKLNCYYIN